MYTMKIEIIKDDKTAQFKLTQIGDIDQLLTKVANTLLNQENLLLPKNVSDEIKNVILKNGKNEVVLEFIASPLDKTNEDSSPEGSRLTTLTIYELDVYEEDGKIYEETGNILDELLLLQEGNEVSVYHKDEIFTETNLGRVIYKPPNYFLTISTYNSWIEILKNIAPWVENICFALRDYTNIIWKQAEFDVGVFLGGKYGMTTLNCILDLLKRDPHPYIELPPELLDLKLPTVSRICLLAVEIDEDEIIDEGLW